MNKLVTRRGIIKVGSAALAMPALILPSRAQLMMMSGAGLGTAVAATIVTFSPALSAAGIVFSNGNLTVNGGTAAFSSAVSTVSVAGGKRYFEATFDISSGVGTAGVGFASTSFNTAQSLGEDSSHESLNYKANSAVRFNAGTISFGDGYTTGDVVNIAVNFTLSPPKAWVGHNGTWTSGADPATGTGGFDVTDGTPLAAGPYWAAVGLFNGDQFTGNFGPSASLPSGFSTWST